MEGAAIDSRDTDSAAKCYENTRVQILHKLQEWVNQDPDDELFFWLYGPAGTGKSKIARALAKSAQENGHCVAGYVFKRGDGQRNGTTYIFPTIARKLLYNIPAFKGCLRKSLNGRGKDEILDQSLKNQFQMLLLDPLNNPHPHRRRPHPSNSSRRNQRSHLLEISLQSRPRRHLRPLTQLLQRPLLPPFHSSPTAWTSGRRLCAWSREHGGPSP